MRLRAIVLALALFKKLPNTAADTADVMNEILMRRRVEAVAT